MKKMVYVANKLNVIDRLQAFSVAANSISNNKKSGNYHIVILDPNQKTVSIESFGRRKLDEATKTYSEYEKEISDVEGIQIVLVSTGSIDSLRQAYPNYFLDTHDFIKVMHEISTKITNNDKKILFSP
ncbi:hypothetical protein HRE53_06035 [Acaryochloris sp. 'Moss Beach']|uniref:hypothetical protein n=1 Tax=Acaryochloris sp. 'Moss Beach' TaxID=2740837 RepID=UPI001F26D3DF|nr:hypothetical protein [Acaryochloris sp. 'Moss Beach']UJB70635.1 hypothetical protein HRE53_06035 [Acaryochloris sp. 'Moss Beach']